MPDWELKYLGRWKMPNTNEQRLEEAIKKKVSEAEREMMRSMSREIDAESQRDMIGARIYYENREAGERWLRMEFQKHKPESITPGESVLIENRCQNPVEVGAGLIFREDGDYIVSVRNGKIAVCKCGCASFKDFDAPPEVIEACERNEKRLKEAVDEFYNVLIAEKRAEIERLKAEISKIPPLDYDKLAENTPEPPKEADNGTNMAL